MHTYHTYRFVGVLTLVALIVLGAKTATAQAPATGTAAKPPTVNKELQGQILIDGSSTVYPITAAVASQFRKLYPNVSVNIGVSGTGGGFKRFVKGETDISDASRPIDAAEVEAAKGHKQTYIELPIAYDGITIVVHPSNDWVDQLTVDEIKKIYLADGAVKSWSEVRAGWPNKPIKPFAPGTDSGTFDYFKEVVAGKTGSLRADMSTSEDDNVLVTGVAGSPDAIAFFGAAYYEENKSRVKAVPVVNPATKKAVLPTSSTIESGEYAPFSRPLFIYINNSAASRPEVKRFVTFYLTNASATAKQVGYVALPEAVIATGSANFKGRKTGTHYLTAEGEKRKGAVTEVYQPANLLELK